MDEYVSFQLVLVQLLVGQINKRQLVISQVSEVDQYREPSDAMDPEGAGTGSSETILGLLGWDSGQSLCGEGQHEAVHQIGPYAHGVGLLEPSDAGAHTLLQGELVHIRSSLVLSVEPAGFWSDGVGGL